MMINDKSRILSIDFIVTRLSEQLPDAMLHQSLYSAKALCSPSKACLNTRVLQEGYKRVTRGLQEGYKRVTKGLLKGY